MVKRKIMSFHKVTKSEKDQTAGRGKTVNGSSGTMKSLTTMLLSRTFTFLILIFPILSVFDRHNNLAEKPGHCLS